MTTSTLAARSCRAIEEPEALTTGEVRSMLEQIDGWEQKDGAIRKTFHFQNFYHTMAFVNAVAWIANCEDHHPDLQVSYNRCSVSYATHSAKALTEKDFICAAKIDALLE
jgi:4a-hydroxytetrahydrobiopterin dehydratase